MAGSGDDVAVVAVKVRPSREAARLEAGKDSHVRAFERSMRDVRRLTSAEGVAQRAIAADLNTAASVTVVFPGAYLGCPRIASSLAAAVAADDARPPLQRGLGRGAARRFVACLAKLIGARGGGPAALEMRELHARCDVVPPGFSYVREVGQSLGYRLDRRLLASHVRQAVLKMDEAASGAPPAPRGGGGGGGSPRRAHPHQREQHYVDADGDYDEL